VQTKIYYLNQVQNQPMYEFLQDFHDHQHLKIVRMTDYDFRCYFHGANGLNLDWQQYLKQLHAIPTKEVTVHFTQPSDSEAVRQATGSAYQESFGEEPAWAAAAASRRSNPFLDEWAGMPHVEYSETLDAAHTAQALLEIGAQLAAEMSHDLLCIQKENELLRLLYTQQFVLRNQTDSKEGPNNGVVPVFMGGEDGFVETLSLSPDGATEIIWESSVLRSSSWDLILRLLTKISCLQVLADLAASPDHASLYTWYKGYLGQHLSSFDGHGPKGVDSTYITDLMKQPFRVSEAGLIDPMYVADRILEHRSTLAQEWRFVLNDISETWPAYQFQE